MLTSPTYRGITATISLYGHNTRVCPRPSPHGRAASPADFEQWRRAEVARWERYTACRSTTLEQVRACRASPVEQVRSWWRERPPSLEELYASNMTRVELQRVEEAVYARCGEESPPDMNPPYGSNAYVGQYGYAEAIRRWARLFPAEQMLVVFSENWQEGADRCAATYDRLMRFMGLESKPELRDAACQQALSASALSGGEGSHPSTRTWSRVDGQTMAKHEQTAIEPASRAALERTLSRANRGLRELLQELGVSRERQPAAFWRGLEEFAPPPSPPPPSRKAKGLSASQVVGAALLILGAAYWALPWRTWYRYTTHQEVQMLTTPGLSRAVSDEE
jgi:hypothetical protein